MKYALSTHRGIATVAFSISSAKFIQQASEASEADYQSCSIEISDIYVY